MFLWICRFCPRLHHPMENDFVKSLRQRERSFAVILIPAFLEHFSYFFLPRFKKNRLIRFEALHSSAVSSSSQVQHHDVCKRIFGSVTTSGSPEQGSAPCRRSRRRRN